MSYVILEGGKAGGGSFKTKPDTLRSDDSFEMLLGLGSGRWQGLSNGLKSLYINSVPLENEDDTTNFKDFAVFFADGDPTQEQLVNFKLGGGGGTTAVGTEVGNSNASGPGPWVTAAVSTSGADFIDLRFVVGALYYQDKKGIRENTMNLELEMRPSGTNNWINPTISNTAPAYNPQGFSIFGTAVKVLIPKVAWSGGTGSTTWNDPSPGYLRITGKTTSAFVKEMRIAVPNTGAYANKTWEVRVRLVEKELVQNDPVEERRTVQWESIAAVTKEVFGEDDAWRGLAWMQIVGKASEQLSGVPSLMGIYKTKIVKTPPSGIYNPATRLYTGSIWDGSYSLNYTDDPAWCIKDLIEDPISGIAALSPGATLDKWDALEVSKYSSQLVSDGKGGTHPRFSMNLKIDQAQNAEDLVQYMAGAVNGLAWDSGDGVWRMKQDKPENPVALYTRDNIVGEFTYQHTDVDTRYNDYTVTFLNKDNKYTEDRARVYDQANIDAYGRKPTTVVAVGATNRQEALRRAMFRLRVSLNETKIVNFVTNRQGMMLRPLDVILVADTDLGYVGTPTASDNRTTTRLASRDGTTLNLGSSVRLENGVSYVVAFTFPNPNYSPETPTQPTTADWQKPTLTISRNVTNTSAQRGDVSTIYIDSPLPAGVAENAVVALAANNLPSLPRQYRVLEVTPQDDEFVSVSALIVDTGKYAAADNVDESAILGQVPSTNVPSPVMPADGMFDVRVYEGDLAIQRVLSVHWDRPGSLFLDGFKVEYQINDGSYVTLKENYKDTYVELVNPTNGKYTFRITSIDRRGRVSAPLVSSIVLDETTGSSPPHDFGTLANRPATGIINQRYTTTDQVPNVTYIWTEDGWKIEATINRDATELAYVGGESLESLKPAEPGATVGMTPSEQALLDQLDADVAAAEALVASIETQVNTDLAAMQTAVTDVQSDITALEASVTSDINALETEIEGLNPMATPNLLENGGFENVVTGWSGTAGWNHFPASQKWGTILSRTAASGTLVLSKNVPVTAGNTYTLSADLALFATSATMYLDMLFKDAGGTILLDAPQTNFPVNTDFDITDSRRKTYKCTATAPVNTASVDVRLVISDPTGFTYAGIRRVKLELGDKATSFTSEASSYTAYQTGVSNTGAIATLNSTVSTLNSTVSTQAVAISTLTSGLATLTNKVTASSNPNVLQNGGFENGLLGWTSGGAASGGWIQTNSGSGYYAYNSTVWSGQNWATLYGAVVPVSAVGQAFTFAADCQVAVSAGSGATAYLEIEFLNSSSAVIAGSTASSAARAAPNNFDDTGVSRNTLVVTGTTPTGVAYVRPKLVVYAPAGVTISNMAWRQAKLERGSIATPYSGEATASQMYTAYSTLNSSFASLSSTVSTQGSSITTLQSSMTSAQGSIATLTTTLNTSSNPNLVPNGGFENGLTGWSGSTGNYTIGNGGVGRYAVTFTNGTYELGSPYFPVEAGGTYTISADTQLNAAGGSVYVDIIYMDAAGATVSGGDSGQNTRAPNHSFATDGSGRAATKFTSTAPAGTTQARARFVLAGVTGISNACVRQIKVEQGSVMTPFSSNASIASVFTVANTATSSVASLSSTVSTQGASISTLQSSMSTAQGDVATLKTQVRTGGGNLIGNSSFVNTAGWSNGLVAGWGASAGINGAGTDWKLPWENNLYIYQPNGISTGNSSYWLTDVSIVAGKWYELSALLATHRCTKTMQIQWLNASGGLISTVDATYPWDYQGGRSAADWQNASIKGLAPAGAVTARCVFYKAPTTAGQGDSWLWMCRPQLVETTQNSGQVAFSPSGNGASVDTINQSVNGVLAKYGVTLDVNNYITGFQQLNNGSTGSFVINADYFAIVKPGGGARTEYSGGNWRVYDSSGNLRVQLGVGF